MKTFKTIFITFSTILFFTYESALSDHSKKSFDKFKVDFANTKLKKNYSKELVDDFLLNTKFIKRVIELDRSQPEFKLTLKQYLNKVVTKTRIQKARKKFKANYKILKKIGDYYKVQPRFVVALWGIESDFGRIGGYFPVVSSITTLVYDGRRAKYFEKELFNSLKIIQEGHIKMKNMKGSWAGAMGQCQFMPSSFIKYAVDWNKDNKKDIWNTKSDVFASASNYLKSVNWNYNQTWGRKVYFKNKNNLIDKKKWYFLSEWSKFGLLNKDKTKLPLAKIKARLIIPEGSKNYGYLVYSNFESLLNWNRSNFFAIAVGILSDQLIFKSNS